MPLPVENVDTDQIIPARFLKVTSRGRVRRKPVPRLRFDAEGNKRPDFPLNDPRYSGCILVAGKNFGCGSSREHAAWAIADYGFRVVISSFFADIHKNNELNNFVLPVVVCRTTSWPNCSRQVEADPATEVRVDLPNQTVENLATGRKESFDINPYKKQCLVGEA